MGSFHFRRMMAALAVSVATLVQACDFGYSVPPPAISIPINSAGKWTYDKATKVLSLEVQPDLSKFGDLVPQKPSGYLGTGGGTNSGIAMISIVLSTYHVAFDSVSPTSYRLSGVVDSGKYILYVQGGGNLGEIDLAEGSGTVTPCP